MREYVSNPDDDLHKIQYNLPEKLSHDISMIIASERNAALPR